LATLLPHVYQTLTAETQIISGGISLLSVAVAIVVAVRREPATQP
jgi:multisubunit Na+/H+ antiporter MnhG subunit